MQRERPAELLRCRSDGTGHAYSNNGRYTDLDEQLPPLTGTSPFSPRLSGLSLSLSNRLAARSGVPKIDPPKVVDYEVDGMHGTGLPDLFVTATSSSTSSGSSSEIMSQDWFGVSVMPSAPESAPLLSTILSTDFSSAAIDYYSDKAKDTAYNQAFCMSQKMHHQYLQIQSRAIDSTNKYASIEVGQTLETFGGLAKLLKQELAQHKQRPHSCGLPGMVISGTLYVAVLQAILIATMLLQSDAEGSGCGTSPDDIHGSSLMSQYVQRLPSLEEEFMSSTQGSPQSIGSLECILNLTKMEYYVTIFNQYLQLFFSVNNADPSIKDANGWRIASPIFDYTACIDTTEAVQNQVRSLLSQSRQLMH